MCSFFMVPEVVMRLFLGVSYGVTMGHERKLSITWVTYSERQGKSG